ncbi:pyridoxal phosphate-dependent decarboxylase family protein [Actinophytocola sp.]|uniref:pyridoxal phosphate-dependent decarboxylase family protein n=1 Tax=Actinophytocola sp. TaxID=1872138 RepID=UPI002ED9DB27
MRASPDASDEPRLSAGTAGADRVRALVTVALDAMSETAATRTGPIPAGGPAAVAAALDGLDLLPPQGVGEAVALDELTRLLTAGSVDPAHPWCAAHLHGPTLAVAAAADLVGSVLNPSMDSWDQAPVASELERELTATLARLCFPAQERPDAVITSGGTESNLLGLLLAREHGRTRLVCGGNAHHSVARAAWLLGLPAPRLVDTDAGRLRADGLDLAADEVVVATAGTTDTGAIDPLAEVGVAARQAGAWLHVDAAYGGAALFSDRLAPRLAGLEHADSVALDLHKFGWQPIAAGILATRAPCTALHVRADYLNAGDDTEAGIPDLLGRSIRTSRRPDCLKIAVTLRALGRQGIAGLVEHCCTLAGQVAREVERHPGLELWGEPTLSTVLVRPVSHDADADADVAAVRRRLLDDGTAVLGRATVDGRVWLKLTLLNPRATLVDYRGLLDLVDATARTLAP